MIDENIFKPPDLPKAADSAFFNFEKRYNKVENIFQQQKRLSLYYFVVAFILLIKPIIFTLIFYYSEISLKLLAVFFIGFAAEILVVRNNWTTKKRALSWYWLSNICLAQLIVAIFSGGFPTSIYFVSFAFIEFLLALRLGKFRNFVPISKLGFFNDNVFEDSRRYYLLEKAYEFAYLRAIKIGEFKEKIEKEKKAFKIWTGISLYSIGIFANFLLAFNVEDKIETFAAILGSVAFLVGVLVFQQVKKRFEPAFILALGIVASINLSLVLNNNQFVFFAIDIFFLGAALSMICRYFNKLHFLRTIDYNRHDISELLSSGNDEYIRIAKKIIND